MGTVYARRIIRDYPNFKLDNVPTFWKNDTIEAFKNFVRDYEITKDEFEKYTGQKYVN